MLITLILGLSSSLGLKGVTLSQAQLPDGRVIAYYYSFRICLAGVSIMVMKFIV